MSESNELSAVLQKLVNAQNVPGLGPGPRAERLSIGEVDERLGSVFKRIEIPEQPQSLVRSIVYLWHDHLDESHSISQNIHSSQGSYLHGVMHRREPDYGNAKYWFHRAGFQPMFSSLAERATEIAKESSGRSDLAHLLVSAGDWDPTAFVDLCADVASMAEDHPDVVTLKAIQHAEFELMLDETIAS